jgi:hypothetical protein
MLLIYIEETTPQSKCQTAASGWNHHKVPLPSADEGCG